MATSNPLFKRLVMENFKEVSRWLGSRVQVEREGWLLKSRLAMQEIEGHRRQQQHAARVLAECATHVRNVLETLHVQHERLEALPSDDCQAALVEGVELLSQVCSQLMEERGQCVEALGLEAAPGESLTALLDRYLQDKDAAFASHRKTCAARQRELEAENTRLCEELADTTQEVTQKQEELEAIFEHLRQENREREEEGEVGPLMEDKCVWTEQTPDGPSPPTTAQPPKPEEGNYPVPSTSSSSATQTSAPMASEEAEENGWEESGIHISEEKLLALKQRARQLEATITSAISSMETMHGTGSVQIMGSMQSTGSMNSTGSTKGTESTRARVNGIVHGSGVLHGFSALSVLHYSQCERSQQQAGQGNTEDKGREPRGGRSRRDRAKSERNHPSWSLDREQGHRPRKARIQSERNHPTWNDSATDGVAGHLAGTETSRPGRRPPDWALQNAVGERGRQERGSPERHAPAKTMDLSPTERGKAERVRWEKSHPGWGHGTAGRERARTERAMSERDHPSRKSDWRKASFEVTCIASTSALPNASAPDSLAARDARSDADRTSRTFLGGVPPELSRSSQIVSYGSLGAGMTSGRTVRPRQVDRCLRCQQLYSRTDNHKLACCYHPKGKERREMYSSTGQLQKVTNLWNCCQRRDDSEGCCFGQHI